MTVYHHSDTCTCCQCLKHNKCISVHNPKWKCLMPNRINEIVFGPLNPLQADCILEVNESIKTPFKIINKYVYPTFLNQGMITLSILTPTCYIIKPGALLATLCTITTENVLEEINGKKI